MDADEEPGSAVEGVVKNGRVIPDAPLAVADGTRVTIRPSPTAEAEPSELTADQIRWFREHTDRLRARAAADHGDVRAA